MQIRRRIRPKKHDARKDVVLRRLSIRVICVHLRINSSITPPSQDHERPSRARRRQTDDEMRRVVVDQGHWYPRDGHSRARSETQRSIDGLSTQSGSSEACCTPALDDPGRDGLGCRPGTGPGEIGRFFGRRARPAAAGPDAGTTRRIPGAARPGRRVDPWRPADDREHRSVDADRPRVPVLQDHLARLAARPAIRLPRRGAGPGIGLQ